MLRTCGIEFARRAFFVVAPIANPTKTNPIQSSSEVIKRRRTPAAVVGPDRSRRTRATTTPGSATTRPLMESPTAYEAGDTFDATSMSWKRNHCLLKYTLCQANKPVNENVNTMAPTRDCIADRWSANTKMKMTGKNEKRLITTRSIGSRRRGRASKSPMYRASRILDLNRSPHDLDERVFEARRFERDLALLAQAPLDNREDLLRRSRFEYLRRRRSIARGRLYDDAHPQARVTFRLLHGPEEGGASLVHDEQVVREDLRLVEVVRGQEDRRALPRELPQHVPDRTPAEGIQPDRGLVEEQNLRVRDHGHRDDETLTKTAGQVRCELVAVLPQAQVLHDLLRSLAGLRARLPADEAEVEDVIVGRQEHLRAGLLRDDGDVRADCLRLLEYVMAEDRCAAHARLELGPGRR